MAEQDLRLNAGQYISEVNKARKGTEALRTASQEFDIQVQKLADGTFEYTRTLKFLGQQGQVTTQTFKKQAKSAKELDSINEKLVSTSVQLASAFQKQAQEAEELARIRSVNAQREEAAYQQQLTQINALQAAQQKKQQTERETQLAKQSAFAKDVEFTEQLLAKEQEAQDKKTKLREKDIEEYIRLLQQREDFFNAQNQELLRIEQRGIAARASARRKEVQAAFEENDRRLKAELEAYNQHNKDLLKIEQEGNARRAAQRKSDFQAAVDAEEKQYRDQEQALLDIENRGIAARSSARRKDVQAAFDAEDRRLKAEKDAYDQHNKDLLKIEEEANARRAAQRKSDFQAAVDAQEKQYRQEEQALLETEKRREKARRARRKRDVEFAFTGQAAKETRAGLLAIVAAAKEVENQQKKVAKSWTSLRQVAQRTTGRTLSSLKKIKKRTKENKEEVDLLTKGWKSFFRLIALRAAAGLFFKLRQDLLQLGKDFAEFNKGVAETQTIIRPNEQNLAGQTRISSEVIRAAINNNIELSDSVEAFYDNLSNQVSNNLAGLSAFTNTAIRLSKATVSSLEDSGNAISSVVQAYNLSFADAEKISATLFKTVDEGRLRLNEVANTLGTIGVPANALGITFEETSAALARLTLQGINVNRSQTLLRNLFLKLLKPTENLQALYEQWGVNTGEQAVQAFGLSGVLKKLNKESERGADVLPDLFSRIRAILGAQGLAGTTENVEKFIDTLTAVSDASSQFSTAIQVIEESAGEKFQKELNKTKILFTTVFGQAVVKSVNDVNEAIQNATDNTQSLANVIIRASTETLAFTSAIGGMTAGFIAAKTAAIILGVELQKLTYRNPYLLGAALLGAAVAFLVGKFVQARLEAERFAQELRTVEADKATKAIENFAKAVDNSFRGLRDQFREYSAALAGVRKNYKSIETANDRIIDTTKRILENEIKNAEAIVNSKEATIDIVDLQTGRVVAVRETNSELERQLEIEEDILSTAKSALQTSIDRVKTLSQSFASDRFARSIRGLSPLNQINAQIERAKQLSREAFASADVEEGRKLLDEARQLLNSADSSNFSEFGRGLSEELFRGLENATFQFERNAQAQARTAQAQADAKIKELENKIRNNNLQLEQTKKALDGLETANENILRIIEDQQLAYDQKAKLIEEEIGILGQYKGIQADILGLLQSQFNVKVASAAIDAEQNQLSLDKDRVAALATDQKEAFSNFRNAAGSFRTEVNTTTREYLEQIESELEELYRNPPAFNPVAIERFRNRTGQLSGSKEAIKTFQAQMDKVFGDLFNEELDISLRESAYDNALRQFFALEQALSTVFDVAQNDAIVESMSAAAATASDVRENSSALIQLYEEEQQLLQNIAGYNERINELRAEESRLNVEVAKKVNAANNAFKAETQQRFNEASAPDGTVFTGVPGESESNADFDNKLTALANYLDGRIEATIQANKLEAEGVQVTESYIAAKERQIQRQEEFNRKLAEAKAEEARQDATERVGGATNLTPDQLDAKAKAIQDFKNRLAEDPENKTNTVVTNIADDSDRLSRNIEFVDGQWKAVQPTMVQQEATLAATNTNLENIGESQNLLVQNAASFIEAVNGEAGAINNKAAAVERLNRANNGATGTTGGIVGNQQNLWRGGLVRYLSGGGFIPRGTDTVPAMLTPGEFVVNRRAAQKNMGLLTRLNNHEPIRPQYFNEGGEVHNTFNNTITMPSTGNEALDARRLNRELTRGQRRGTSGPAKRRF